MPAKPYWLRGLGFSDAAQRKARRLGITLCIASSAKASVWDVGTQIPVILTELKCTELRPEFDIYLHSGADLPDDCGFTINDLSLEDALCEAIRSGEVECSPADGSFDWFPLGMTDPFIRDKKSVRIPIANLMVHVSVRCVTSLGTSKICRIRKVCSTFRRIGDISLL